MAQKYELAKRKTLVDHLKGTATYATVGAVSTIVLPLSLPVGIGVGAGVYVWKESPTTRAVVGGVAKTCYDLGAAGLGLGWDGIKSAYRWATGEKPKQLEERVKDEE